MNVVTRGGGCSWGCSGTCITKEVLQTGQLYIGEWYWHPQWEGYIRVTLVGENAGGLNLQNVLGLSPLGLQWYYNETTVLTNSYSKYIRHAPFMTGIIAICCTVSALWQPLSPARHHWRDSSLATWCKSFSSSRASGKFSRHLSMSFLVNSFGFFSTTSTTSGSINHFGIAVCACMYVSVVCMH